METYSALCSSAISVTTYCVLPIPDQVLPPFGAIIVAFNMGAWLEVRSLAQITS
jgi:hypothetical protein